MAVGHSSGCGGSCITSTTLQCLVCYCEYQSAFDGYQYLGISLSFNHFGFFLVFLPVQWWHSREWQLSLLWRFQRHSLPHLCKPKQARRELWWRSVTDGDTKGKLRTRIMVQIQVYWIPFWQDQHQERSDKNVIMCVPSNNSGGNMFNVTVVMFWKHQPNLGVSC